MKKRLDVLLVEQGFFPSRERAKAVIMAGQVYVENQKADKPGAEYPQDAAVQVRGEPMRYVSRGGLKLEKALTSFPVALDGTVCMDIGASTGGFTDCMLQNGAVKVYAIDVGYGQLAWKLRCDPRVINLERTNIRYLTAQQLPEQVDFFSVDVSFISLSLVLPAAAPFLRDEGEAICLVKPQFEAGREKVGKKGVVRDPATHIQVLERAVAYAAQAGFILLGLDYSPIRGPEGNIEYLMYLRKSLGESSLQTGQIKALVEASHTTLDR